MPKEDDTSFKSLETPLLFASKSNFSNLSKIKNLEDIMSDISLKLMSAEKRPDVKKELAKIRENFKDFENSEVEHKKDIINSTLELIVKLKKRYSKVTVNDNFTDKKEKKVKNSANLTINDSIRYIKGVGPRISDILSKKEINTIEDLIFYFPRKYEDRRNVKTISSLEPNTKSIIVATVLSSREISSRKGKLYKVTVSDGTGVLNLVWFKASKKYIETTFKKDVRIVVSGDISYNSYDRALQIIHPKPQDLEIIEDGEELEHTMHFNRIVPVYPLTEGLTQRRIRSIIRTVLDTYLNKLEISLPEALLKKLSLIELNEAIREVHFPEKYDNVVDLGIQEQVEESAPHRTLAVFEFLVLELGLGLKKRNIVERSGISFNSSGLYSKEFLKNLPFNLTDSQIGVINEINEDMKSPSPMNRLVQGDVGSGKTVISIMSILNAVECGYQAALMAPTEILCEQHYRSLLRYLEGTDLNIVLLKSALNSTLKRKIYRSINSGKSNIVVGTHALIEESVDFKNLGLVVIDEQHRFGVMQRAKLMDKAENPDVLVLTATPIPRTLAITVYGDLDISIIDKLPPGRKQISTFHYKDNDKNREELSALLRSELDKGRQGYVICPFIDESENPDFKHIKYVGNVYENIKNNILPEYSIGLLHGRMSSEEKDEVMKKFAENSIDVLVSTTVIEVGVDVPNATFMVIENSERYGLSQLHQLRGRIGRGSHESFCILISDYAVSEESQMKLDIMTKTSDGFKIAEADLKLRGPGDFLGTKQSGIPQFKFANLIRDWKLLNKSRETAFQIIAEDPNLDKIPEIKRYINSKWGEMLGIQLMS